MQTGRKLFARGANAHPKHLRDTGCAVTCLSLTSVTFDTHSTLTYHSVSHPASSFTCTLALGLNLGLPSDLTFGIAFPLQFQPHPRPLPFDNHILCAHAAIRSSAIQSKMAASESDSQRTIRIALRHIDQHRGEYNTTATQDLMLGRLIRQHTFEYRPRGGTRDERLAINAYRSRLYHTVSRDGLQGVSLHDLFMKGTKVLRATAREKYTMDEASPIQDSEDELSAGALDQANDIQGTAQIDAPKKRSTASTSAFEAGGDDGKDLPQPTWSPLTPADLTVPEGQKRKWMDEEDAEYGATTVTRRGTYVDLRSPAPASSSNVIVNQAPKKRLATSELQDAPNDASRKSSAGPGQAAESDASRGLVKLSEQTIRQELSTIWMNIQSFTCELFEGLGIDADGRAELVTKPHPELEELYKKMFGKEWLERASSLLTAGVMGSRRLVDACTATAVHLMVFLEPLPWDGPAELMSSLSEARPQVDRVLHMTGKSGCRRDHRPFLTSPLSVPSPPPYCDMASCDQPSAGSGVSPAHHPSTCGRPGQQIPGDHEHAIGVSRSEQGEGGLGRGQEEASRASHRHLLSGSRAKGPAASGARLLHDNVA